MFPIIISSNAFVSLSQEVLRYDCLLAVWLLLVGLDFLPGLFVLHSNSKTNFQKINPSCIYAINLQIDMQSLSIF